MGGISFAGEIESVPEKVKIQSKKKSKKASKKKKSGNLPEKTITKSFTKDMVFREIMELCKDSSNPTLKRMYDKIMGKNMKGKHNIGFQQRIIEDTIDAVLECFDLVKKMGEK